MPDLDQIKQEEQERGMGVGGFPRAGPWATPWGGHHDAARLWLMLAVPGPGLGWGRGPLWLSSRT